MNMRQKLGEYKILNNNLNDEINQLKSIINNNNNNNDKINLIREISNLRKENNNIKICFK